MPEQTGPGPERRYLPPVFTRWTGSTQAAPPGERAAPPFIPEAGARPDRRTPDPLEAASALPVREPVSDPFADRASIVDAAPGFESEPAAGPAEPASAGSPPLSSDGLRTDPVGGVSDDPFADPVGVASIPPADVAALPMLDDPLTPAAGSGAVIELADRLERIAARLRSEGAAALGPGLTGSDRLDAILTGLLAGYLAGRDG
ncbi:MAG TPA: hypothetical protein VF188_12480 [Longimicrobiales bacterium]